MRTETIHVRAFNSHEPICGAAGIVHTEDDWEKADSDARFRRCRRCDTKLGPGGIQALKKAREELAKLRTAETAERNDAQTRRPSLASAYPIGSLEADAYRRGYDAGQLPERPTEPHRIRTVTAGYGGFVATLEAARARAPNYSDAERKMITAAITRANRSMGKRA